MLNTKLTIEEVTDPPELEEACRQHERHCRNSHWLQSHWADFLPQARGRFIAVAGEQGFIADKPEDAWEWAGKAHPDDNGAIVQYVPLTTGPRIYGNRRPVV